MLKKFLLKKMFAKQLSALPEAQREKLLDAVDKNPELFQKIATETQERIKNGEDQMVATMAVANKYRSELTSVLG